MKPDITLVLFVSTVHIPHTPGKKKSGKRMLSFVMAAADWLLKKRDSNLKKQRQPDFTAAAELPKERSGDGTVISSDCITDMSIYGEPKLPKKEKKKS